jgi:SAM-dependent methyltransferase
MHAEVTTRSTGVGDQGLSDAALVRFCWAIAPRTSMYEVFVNEARFSLARLLPILSSLNGSNPVLEVGAGSCMLAAYLATSKLRVTAVDPLGTEFDFFTDLQDRVLEHCREKGIPLNVIRTTGEQLDLPEQFDLAFTVNSLEHMSAPLQTLDNMYRSLRPGGVLLAHCPNYTIPFDTHFNILLITRWKRLNEWLYRSRIERDPDVWKELNFIRYVDVRRHLARRGLVFRFNQSVVADMVTRIASDRIFADRMPRGVRAISRLLQAAGLLQSLRLLPARWQTPMEVLIYKT